MAISRTFLVGMIIGTIMMIILLWMCYLYRRRLAERIHTRRTTTSPASVEYAFRGQPAITVDYAPAEPDYTPAEPDYIPAEPDYMPAEPEYTPAEPTVETTFEPSAPHIFAAPTTVSSLSDVPPSYAQAVTTDPGPLPPKYDDVI